MPEDIDRPSSSSAEVRILFNGYAKDGDTPTDSYVASTVCFIRDGDARVIIDPGMVPSPNVILEPLAALGELPITITDVVFSHHPPDHTLNAALFPNARFHDHWAIYEHDLWTDREADGFELSPNVALLHVRGHTDEDVATLVRTDDGLVVFTHAWWT